MIEPIVSSDAPVTLVGAGEANPKDLQNSLTLAPRCVAADGGAALALAAGVTPEAVIGDFDSLEPEARAALAPESLHRVAEQDSTDFEKALLRIAAPLVIGVGFMGGRVDHQLAVCHALARFSDRPCLVLGAREVICLAPPRIALPTEEGETVSLFPLAPVEGRSTGLQWPVDGLRFDPMQQIGTSNRATGPMELEMEGPGMLLILPARLMPALVQQFLAPDAVRWPARA